MLGAGPVGAARAAERETPCSHQPASSPRAARLSGSGWSSAGGVPVMIAASSSARYLRKKCPASSSTNTAEVSVRKCHSRYRSW